MIHSTWREKTGREVRSRPGPAQSKTKEKGKEEMLGRTLAYRYYMNKQIDARLVISGFDLHIAKSRQMYSSMKYNNHRIYVDFCSLTPSSAVNPWRRPVLRTIPRALAVKRVSHCLPTDSCTMTEHHQRYQVSSRPGNSDRESYPPRLYRSPQE